MISVYLLKPLTKEAENWIDERIDPDAMRFGGGAAIEHRYVDDIMMGIEIDGLEEHFQLIS